MPMGLKGTGTCYKNPLFSQYSYKAQVTTLHL